MNTTEEQKPRTVAEVLRDMRTRADRITRCEPGESETFFAMRDQGLIYNWSGVLYKLEDGGAQDPEPVVEALRTVLT